MADLQKLLDDLSTLTVTEARDLAKLLRIKWGIEIPPASLSAEELKSARADLALWCTPEQFFKKVDVLAGKETLEERFNAPRLGFLRDASILAVFAKELKGVSRVRLAAAADSFPDGFVETSDGTLNIEATEADMETRRRGAEYEAGTPRGESGEEWERQAKVIPVELDRVIRQKVDKNYDPPPTLVVYLNLDGHGTHKAEVENIVEDVKRKYGSSFKGIYVLWNDRLL
jgi:ribosomal L7/L12-like protein